MALPTAQPGSDSPAASATIHSWGRVLSAPRTYVFLAYVLIATIYSVKVPLFESADEIAHYPLVQYLATHRLALPYQDLTNLGAWKQEGSQPPLYYLLSALITAPIDTSDMEDVLRLNVHEGGISYAGEVQNAVVHNLAREAFPWTGTALAVHVVRLLSVLLGLGTVIVTYHLTLEVFPGREDVAVGAAALNAFLPMFLLISASVNNDNLAIFLGNLQTLVLVRLLKSERPPRLRAYVAIGVVAGLGLLAKLSMGLMVPLVAGVLLLASLRFRDRRPLLVGGLVSGGLTIAIAGWWYWRNYTLYGDPTGLNVFLDIAGRQDGDWAALWAERGTLYTSFWGFTGAIYAALPAWVYAVFGGISLIAVVGAVATLAGRRSSRRVAEARALTLVWILATIVSMLRWSLMTPAMQGRLLYGALSSISLWAAAGLAWWLPRRWAAAPPAAAAAFFLVVAVAAPFSTIGPAFALPASVPAGTPVAVFSAAGQGAIGLLRADLVQDERQPDQYLDVAIDWQIVERTPLDWSLFVHLTNPEGVIVAQRDLYPGSGRIATADLAVGRTWRDEIPIYIPPGTYAPADLSVVVGWYYAPTGERLAYSGDETAYPLGEVALEPAENEYGIANPLAVNFDDRIELLGYDMAGLALCPGETFDVSLYWRALQPMDEDYVVFVHVIDTADLTNYAASNTMPANGGRPTSGWSVGEIVADSHTLTVADGAQPGIYDVELGLFLTEGDMPRLSIVADGRRTGTAATLTRVRIRDVSECQEATEAG